MDAKPIYRGGSTSFSDQASAIEVKNWKGGAGIAEARDQLNCYIAKARNEESVTFSRSTELASRAWSMVYLDQFSTEWCVWADRTQLNPGNIYFARADDPSIRSSDSGPGVGGCQQGSGPDLVAKSQNVLRIALNELLKVVTFEYLLSRIPAIFLPARQETAADCRAFYAVTVMMDPSRPTTLALDYGDGQSATATIPQGTGLIDLPVFVHQFAIGEFEYVERATILERQLTSEASTYHPRPIATTPPDIQPAQQGTRNDGIAAYAVTVPKERKWPTTLRMEYGDGAVETRGIPQGLGSVSFNFSHTFASSAYYIQSATIPEATASNARSITQANRNACDNENGGINLTPCYTISRPEIKQEWQALGGKNGFLGDVTSNTADTPCGGGKYNSFQNGDIFWRSDAGAHEVHSAIRDKWNNLSATCGYLGFPQSDQFNGSKSGGYGERFQGGTIYSSYRGTFALNGDTLAKYGQFGSEGGVLGYPTADIVGATGRYGSGTVATFEGGSIYWSPGSGGAHEIQGSSLAKYVSVGAEGALGFPTSDSTPTACRSALYNNFENGDAILWRSDLGAFLNGGAIRQKWASLGYECSYLGLPTSDEIWDYGPPPGGTNGDQNVRHQYFQGSDITWNKYNGDTYAWGQGGGITGNYYANFDYSNVTLRRGDYGIDLPWNGGSPGPGVGGENFYVEWRGRLQIPTTGYYTFYTISDDGVQFGTCPSNNGFACGQTINISNWTDHGATENSSGSMYMTAGTHHVSLFFYQRCCGSVIQMLWEGPGIGKQIIPGVYWDASYWGANSGQSPAAAQGGAAQSPAQMTEQNKESLPRPSV